MAGLQAHRHGSDEIGTHLLLLRVAQAFHRIDKELPNEPIADLTGSFQRPQAIGEDSQTVSAGKRCLFDDASTRLGADGNSTRRCGSPREF
jgi:hypothetical protein